MGGWLAYLPRTAVEERELAEYRGRWGERGLEGLACYVIGHDERAHWIRSALERGKAICPSDFGLKRWWEPDINYW